MYILQAYDVDQISYLKLVDVLPMLGFLNTAIDLNVKFLYIGVLVVKGG